LIELIDERINEQTAPRGRHRSEDQRLDGLNLDVGDQISNWMSDNFDVTDYNVDDAISAWMSNNMTDEIESVIKNSLTFSVIVN
jgi:hypothetical protein